MSSIVDRLLALHGWAVVAAVFALPALESSAFVGFVFPGEIAVLLGGVLAFEHRVSLPAVIAAAVAGAIIGDTLGYLVGMRWGRAILDGSIGRIVKAEHLDKAEHYLAERGGKAVFFGRFTAALRVMVPGLAGMAKMPYRTFALNNAAGGALWATGFVLLGYAAGTSWRRVEHVAKNASLLLLAVLVVLGVVFFVARWLVRHPERLRAAAARQLNRPLIARLRRRHHRQLAFLGRRLRPGGTLGLSLTVGVLVLIGAGWAFGTVLQDVLARDDGYLLDGPVQRFFVTHRESGFTTLMRAITDFGNSAVLIGLVLLAGLVWRRRRRTWRPLALLAGAYAGAYLLSNSVKLLVHRPRPPAAQAIGHWAGLGFPSGHATDAAAVYGMLAALLAAATVHWGRKVAIWAVASVLIGLVGLSRLYLGAHWFTDVLGGLALGGAWLFALLTLARTVQELPEAFGGQGPPGRRPDPAVPAGRPPSPAAVDLQQTAERRRPTG